MECFILHFTILFNYSQSFKIFYQWCLSHFKTFVEIQTAMINIVWTCQFYIDNSVNYNKFKFDHLCQLQLIKIVGNCNISTETFRKNKASVRKVFNCSKNVQSRESKKWRKSFKLVLFERWIGRTFSKTVLVHYKSRRGRVNKSFSRNRTCKI